MGEARRALDRAVARALAPPPPAPAVQRVGAAMLMADISGYTRLSERLAERGRAGTEQLSELIDRCFTDLIDIVHAHGGDVLRFGGDALFVLFGGQEAAERSGRARRAAAAMQRAVAGRPAVPVDGGQVRLRQSIGVHDGELVVVRWDGAWREELVLGPAVSDTLLLESRARPGQVLVSEAAGGAGPRRRPAPLASVTRAGRPLVVPARRPGRPDDDAAGRLPPLLVDALRSAGPEHRDIVVAFVGVGGLDALCGGALDGLRDAVTEAMDVVTRAADDADVLPFATDVAVDGFTVLLAAGLPRATGDEAGRLLGAARRIADRLGTRVRIGVHAGPAFVGLIGHPERRTYAAVGDTMNVASRLKDGAPPGGVVASSTVIDDVGARYDLSWGDPLPLRGRRRPVAVARVGPSRPWPPAFAGAPPLHGRVDERRAVRAALDGEGPRLVEIVGPAGIGKSRLVEEVVDRIGRPVWFARATVDGSAVPFGLATRLAVAAGIAPVGDLAGPADEQRRDAELVAERAAADRASRLLDRLPDRAVVVVDGIDFADASSIRVVERLVAGAATSDAAFVLTHRGDRRVTVADGVARTAVTLGPLDDAALRAVVLDAAVVPLSDHDVGRIVARATGVPRTARRLARLGRVDGDLPSGVEATIAAELDQLPRAAREMVRVAALVGSEVDADEVAAAAGVTVREVTGALAPAAHLLPATGDGRLAFRDEAVRRVAADSMPVRDRVARQRRVADHLTATVDTGTLAGLVRVAAAWMAAGDDAEVVRWCRRAGEAAARAGAPHEAADLLWAAAQAAQRLGAPAIHVVELAEAVADSASAAGRLERTGAALTLASALARDPAQRAVLLARRARHASRLGRYRSASALAGAAVRLAGGLEAGPGLDADEVRRVRLTTGLERAQVCFDQGRYAQAGALAAELVGDAEASGLRRHQAQALALAEMVASVSGRGDGEQLGRRAHELAVEVGDVLLAGAVACNIGIGLDNRGRWPEALDWYRRAEAHFTGAGSAWSVALAALNRSTILAELGDIDAATAACTAAGRELAAANVPALALIASSHLARLRARAGVDVDAQIARLEQAIVELGALGEDEAKGFRRAALVETLLLAGRAEPALREAQSLLASVAALGDDHLLPVTARRLLALAWRSCGDADRAGAEIDAAVAAARRSDAPPEVCLSLHVARLLAHDRGAPLPAGADAELAALERELGVVSYPWIERPLDR